MQPTVRTQRKAEIQTEKRITYRQDGAELQDRKDSAGLSEFMLRKNKKAVDKNMIMK